MALTVPTPLETLPLKSYSSRERREVFTARGGQSPGPKKANVNVARPCPSPPRTALTRLPSARSEETASAAADSVASHARNDELVL